MLIILPNLVVYSEKKLGDLGQVMEDHCYSRRKGDPKDTEVEVDVCVKDDKKNGGKCSKPCLNETSKDTNKTAIVQVTF